MPNDDFTGRRTILAHRPSRNIIVNISEDQLYEGRLKSGEVVLYGRLFVGTIALKVVEGVQGSSTCEL